MTTFSVLVTGFPPGVHKPELKPGETLLQFLIRYHPIEWKNFVERVGDKQGLSASDRKQLLEDPKDLKRPLLIKEVEKWANMRLPVHMRTLYCLSELRSSLSKEPMKVFGLQMVQIIWPREKNPSGDDSAERMAASMGVEIVGIRTGTPREIDFRTIIPMVTGEYLWIVPGGSSFMSAMTAMSLQRIFRSMHADQSVAVYSDGAFSMIYRMTALRSLCNEKQVAELTLSSLNKLLAQRHFSCIGDRDPDHPLCEIERIYGGTYPFPETGGSFSRFKKLFRR